MSETMAETICHKNSPVFRPFRFSETKAETICEKHAQPIGNVQENMKRFLKRWSVDEGGAYAPSYSIETFHSFSRGPH